MSNFSWCHGPTCHGQHTQDRIRGVKGSKVLRTKKIKEQTWTRNSFYAYFCSQGCYNDFANTYVREVIALHPRTEALETPIEVTRTPSTDWGGRPCIDTTIKTVDNV
jgi:hypothetical protein